uniref:Uncharacterized protein n=1 Tax=Panagrolaimus sp. JU765 TaxID=591449 RepID=A0AC34QZ48_9BILA
MEFHEEINWDHGMNIFDWIIVGGSIVSTTIVGIGFGLNDLFYDRTILRRQEVEERTVGEESTEEPLLKKNSPSIIKTAISNSVKEKQSSREKAVPPPESSNVTS